MKGERNKTLQQQMTDKYNRFQVVTFLYGLQHNSQSCWPDSSWPFIDLTGTIPSFHHSVPEAMNGEQSLGVIPASGNFSVLQGTVSN